MTREQRKQADWENGILQGIEKAIQTVLKRGEDTVKLTIDAETARMLATALREKAERERGWGCAYCVIGRRSPDARYCSNCGRKLTPALPELANESEEVNPDSHQYVDNDSTNRRKSVKQKCRNLHSETAETCTLRCDYCGKYAKESDLTTVWIADKYLMCRKCRGNDWPCLCANGEEQVVESVSSPPYRANYCGLCGRFIGGDYA